MVATQTFLKFSPRSLGKMHPFWRPHIFQMGWFNHQLAFSHPLDVTPSESWDFLRGKSSREPFFNTWRVAIVDGPRWASRIVGRWSFQKIFWTKTHGDYMWLYIYIYLEPKWPLFWLEFRPCFEGLTFKDRGPKGVLGIYFLSQFLKFY